jgi:hypothetical protein
MTMSNRTAVSWTDWHGGTVEVNMIADARSFVGMAGYPWIIMAANPQLSNAVLDRYLRDCGIDGAERTPSWLQRKRWMFRRVPAGNTNGSTVDRDGKQARAVRIMREHPKMSLRQLVYLLKERGIIRKREWVRTHRVDGG